MKVGLIISIYKSPDFLDRVLCSVKRQTVLPSEVIVSEDGEFLANAAIVQKWRAGWPSNSKLIHLTQKDLGNRKPLAMNKAVSQATSPYLVFIDGDCVLREDFIEAHLKFSDRKCFLTGRRVELSEAANKILTVDYINSGKLEFFPLRLIWTSIFGQTFHFFRFFRTAGFWRKIFRRDHVNDIRGCNFSVHREHLVRINGFNNDFSGAYEEDTETQFRLLFLGLKMKSVRNAAIQYHLWHRQQVKDPENLRRLQEIIAQRGYLALNGFRESAKIP